ncbi:MAG: hypothetical protein RL648_644, partial [Verrucomicrobiota bacterium]
MSDTGRVRFEGLAQAWEQRCA